MPKEERKFNNKQARAGRKNTAHSVSCHTETSRETNCLRQLNRERHCNN